MTKSGDSNYAVGRGRPPTASRFKPGRSGNPSGRPKGTQSFGSVLRKALGTKVMITENGRQRRITKLEAMTTQLVNKATQADMNAMRLLTSLFEFHQEQTKPLGAKDRSTADERVMKQLAERLQTLKQESDDDDSSSATSSRPAPY